MVSGTERIAREFLIVGLAIWQDTKVHRSEEHSTEVGRRQSRAEVERGGRKGNSRVNLAADCRSTVFFCSFRDWYRISIYTWRTQPMWCQSFRVSLAKRTTRTISSESPMLWLTCRAKMSRACSPKNARMDYEISWTSISYHILFSHVYYALQRVIGAYICTSTETVIYAKKKANKNRFPKGNPRFVVWWHFPLRHSDDWQKCDMFVLIDNAN